MIRKNKSIINISKSKGPKIEPLGAPLFYNSKIQYLIRFVFDYAVVVNFRPKIQINRIFDI